MANKSIDLDMTQMSYSLGVIIASSYLNNEKEEGVLSECSDSLIEAISKENLEIEIVEGAVKETIAKYIRKHGIEGMANKILADYNINKID